MNRRNFLRAGSTTLAGLGMATLLPKSVYADDKPSKAAMALFDAPLKEGKYELPALPYAYDALEPSIDEQTVRLHHDIHFNGYRKGLNKALDTLAETRASDDFSYIAHWENQLAFHGSGYILHMVFFQNMAPVGTTQPTEKLNRLISADFGHFDAFKAHFSSAAGEVQGSGWGILGYQPVGRRLIILQAEKHQNLNQWGVIPILVLDVWEHAYYLKYQNRRRDYIENWWNVVNWQNVESRLSTALSL